MTRPTLSRTRPWLTFATYALLTIIMTWPLAAQLGTHIPGSEGDTWVHQWTFHYVRDYLHQPDGTFFHTDLMYHPDGISLRYHNFAWLHIALWLPLQALIGAEAAYSLIFLFGFTFTGFTTYLLSRDLIQQELPAFTAGLIAAFWPYTLSHHNHPNLIFIGFVPLVLLYTKRTITSQRWRDTLLLGLFIALVGLTRWQLLVMSGFLMGFYALYLLYQHRSQLKTHLTRLLAASLLAFLLMSPLLTPLLIAQLTRANPADLSADEQRTGQTDLLAYLVPSRYHPLWGNAVFPLTQNFTVDRVFTPFLGFTTLFLAAYGAIKQKKATRFWLMAALLYIVLALGGYLQINGRFTIPLPYLLLEDSFIGAMVRRASRLNVTLSIPIALLAGWGMAALRPQRRWPLLLIPLILCEYIVTYPTFALTTPSWYETLATEEGDFAILDLPLHPRIYDKQYMYYQFVHGRPLVGGHVSRPPREAFHFIDSIPFLRDFQVNLDPIANITAPGEQLRRLAVQNVRYVVLHKSFLTAEKVAHWRVWFAINPAYEDESVLVYHTALENGRDYILLDEILPGVGLAHSHITPTATTQEGWLTIETVWASATAVSTEADICLSLQDNTGTKHHTHCETAVRPTASWEAGEIIRASQQMQVSPYLPSGTYTVVADWRTEPTSESIIGETVMLGAIELTAVERSFTKPEPTINLGNTAVWGDDLIQLLGYEQTHTAEQIQLTLQWHARARPTRSYATFIHLVNPATGEIVAQRDAAPRNWGYPTNWWEAGEYVTDEIAVDLTAVDAGTYDVRLGWYEVETQQRLPLADGAEYFALPPVAVP